MASKIKCPYCGAAIKTHDRYCPECGGPNEAYIADMEKRIVHPRTIEEMLEYCAEHGMPLQKMRFFIGEDYRQPKAFGIYRDGNTFIVYKNKANGERAVRYRGPNEAHAVNELFQKLLDECHNRGIYPDGGAPGTSAAGKRRRTKGSWVLMIPVFIVAVSLAVSAVFAVVSKVKHKNDGYYGTGDGTVYYRYGEDWYYSYDYDYGGDWYETDEFPEDDYREYALGDDWDSGWGVSDFRDSDTWEEIQERDSSSSDYDSPDYDDWDAGDTDWDTDW